MSQMSDAFELIVIGAGPAGIAAAVEGAARGARVALLDEQSGPGGQIYRNVTNASAKRKNLLGKDYAVGDALARQLMESDVDRRFGANVWHVGADGAVAYSVDGNAIRIKGQHIVLASGAVERAVPLPGWTLPGVMTAGAAQIMLKSNGIVARDAVLVGSGPLLYLLAVQMAEAGAPPKAIVETQGLGDLRAAIRHWPGLLRGWRQIAKGIGLLGRLRRLRVKRYTGARDIRVVGQDAAEAVQFLHRGQSHQIRTNHVFLHQGVIPNTQISRGLRLGHRFNAQQRCFCPDVDEYGQKQRCCALKR